MVFFPLLCPHIFWLAQFFFFGTGRGSGCFVLFCFVKTAMYFADCQYYQCSPNNINMNHSIRLQKMFCHLMKGCCSVLDYLLGSSTFKCIFIYSAIISFSILVFTSQCSNTHAAIVQGRVRWKGSILKSIHLQSDDASVDTAQKPSRKLLTWKWQS